MMLIVLVLAVPIGVAASIYLEEFAPKNRLTDLIEVNINNLAAVPSIVFGLLGLAVFINFLGLPRSASLVGGLVLALMTLPTIIIATRAALTARAAVDPRGGARLGASKMQMVFHHVLPLAVPGILTGTIIGLAHALGETAPLLLIGMVAFVADYPTDAARSGDGAAGADLHVGQRAPSAPSSSARRAPSSSCSLFLIVMNVARHHPAPALRAPLVGRSVWTMNMMTEARRRNQRAGPDGSTTNVATKIDRQGRQRLLRREAGAVSTSTSTFRDSSVTALIGPSGCGKSTFLRCLNRMNDTIDGCRVTGKITLDGEDIYDQAIDVGGAARPRRHGVPEAQSVPEVDLRERRLRPAHPRPCQRKAELDEIVEASLQRPACGTRSRIACNEPGTGLSGGQQQRLCIARAIAVNPEVILMDEPCSALDPIATAKVEELIDELQAELHASSSSRTRCSRQRACPSARRSSISAILVEEGETEQIFTNPTTSAPRTTSPAVSAERSNARREIDMISEHIRFRRFDEELDASTKIATWAASPSTSSASLRRARSAATALPSRSSKATSRSTRSSARSRTRSSP